MAEVRRAHGLNEQPISLEVRINHEGDQPLQDLIADEHGVGPEDQWVEEDASVHLLGWLG